MGFRSKWGCRDNTLLVRVLYDQVMRQDRRCVVTFIDYFAVFDFVSHEFMNATLIIAGVSRKNRVIFRVIYVAATGTVRVNNTDGQHHYSGSFHVRRGVIQGDIISPILFILVGPTLGI